MLLLDLSDPVLHPEKKEILYLTPLAFLKQSLSLQV